MVELLEPVHQHSTIQFGYYLTAKRKNPTKQIFNILIKPYVTSVDEKEGFIGEIPSPEIENDPNNIILVYAVSFEKILNAYYTGQKISTTLIAEAQEYLNSK